VHLLLFLSKRNEDNDDDGEDVDKGKPSAPRQPKARGVGTTQIVPAGCNGLLLLQ
jgi:hypothetical protein